MVQHKIHDLLAKYRLEPTIRDVFVEGPADHRIVGWALQASGCRDAAVLEIDAVEVPPDVLRRHSLTGGARQKVQALAWELERVLGPTACQPTCVIDADCDRLLGISQDGALLFATDFPSIEAYLFHANDIGKLIQLVMGRRLPDVATTMREYGTVLQELFLIRAASQRLNLAMGWLDFTKCCTGRDPDPVALNAEEFINRLLNASGLGRSRRELLDTIESLRPRVHPDIRHQIHGHDLLSLLNFANSRHAKARELRNEEAVGSALVGCMDSERISREPLFGTLRERVSLAGPQS